jgi:hypothetical protein
MMSADSTAIGHDRGPSGILRDVRWARLSYLRQPRWVDDDRKPVPVEIGGHKEPYLE